MLKVNEYGGRQAKGNEKRQCFKGWETLVNNIQRYSERTYVCSCHWSTIELVYDKDTCQSP